MNTEAEKINKDIEEYIRIMRSLTESANKEAILSIKLEDSKSTYIPNEHESKIAVQHWNTISGQFLEYLDTHKSK